MRARLAVLLSALALTRCITITVHHTVTVRRTVTVTHTESVDTVFARGVEAELLARSLPDGPEKQKALAIARQAYDAILKVLPYDTPTYSNRANIRLQTGDTKGAIGDLQEAAWYGVGPDRAFYLRRLGQAYEAAQKPYESRQGYWQALEWDPHERTAHQRILEYLPHAPQIQVTNYFRFLLETSQTLRLLDAVQVLGGKGDSEGLAAATAASLAQAAVVVPPDHLTELAAAALAQEGAAGNELRAVLECRRTDWQWLAAHGDQAATTDHPPHAAYRRLARTLGRAAAARGDHGLAERELRLAMDMPGADLEDLIALLEFYSDYGTEAQVHELVEQYEPVSIDNPQFHTAAATAYALFPACGDTLWGVRHHLLRLALLHTDAPPFALDACKVADTSMSVAAKDEPQGCPMHESREPHGYLLDTTSDDECYRQDVLVLAADYSKWMPPLVIEAASSNSEGVRKLLTDNGVDPARIMIADGRTGRVRIRFAR